MTEVSAEVYQVGYLTRGDECEKQEAWLSPCLAYRYALARTWDAARPRAVFIGLNPSIADGFRDDPTVRRCRAFARRWGYGGLVMANLFAFRATDPRAMKAAVDPIGPENDAWLTRLAAEEFDTEIGDRSAGEPGERNLIVACWGVHGSHRDRDRAVFALVPHLYCLGVTQRGYPRHPLYVRSDRELCQYEVNPPRGNAGRK